MSDSGKNVVRNFKLMKYVGLLFVNFCNLQGEEQEMAIDTKPASNAREVTIIFLVIFRFN